MFRSFISELGEQFWFTVNFYVYDKTWLPQWFRRRVAENYMRYLSEEELS